MKRLLLLLLPMLALCGVSAAQDTGYHVERNISYTSDVGADDSYRESKCKLDIYYPLDLEGFSTIVWFHGGGLEGGGKFFPQPLLDQGFAVVAVDYRLSPKVQNPTYTQDAAEATAWVFSNIEKYGGDVNKIFISGHSAGGYLALMLTLDKRYLATYNVDANRIAAAFPISGQTLTHYTIRKERGINIALPLIDEYAPASSARADASPLYLITGDRSLELAARYEENALLDAVLREMGQQVYLYELDGFDHNSVVPAACTLIRTKVKQFNFK